jgi:uroporphyrinogen decarboxylase
MLNHRELLEKTLCGESVSNLPIAFWRHFPVDDQESLQLARSTLAFQNMFDFDFVKITPSSSFCLEDWGAKDQWSGNPEGTREYFNQVIKKPEDLPSLHKLDPEKGSLARQIECITLIRKGLNPNTPCIQTIFSPLSQLKNLVGRENLSTFIRKFPEETHMGLDAITKSTLAFIEECVRIGIDGIYFAVQQATFEILTKEEFQNFGKKYDQMFFDYLSHFWFNVLHLHGNRLMFDLVADYPYQVFNWHDKETAPNLKEGFAAIKKTVCGGISRINGMVLGDSQFISDEINEAKNLMEGKHLIIGTGCVLPQTTPLGNIFSAVKFCRKQHI